MFNFNDWKSNQLQEKQILFNSGSRFGQIVFVVGGAGSGKDFAISNFMEKTKFKVRDVDEWKRMIMRLDAISHDSTLRQKGLSTGTAGLNFRKPSDVAKLHQIVQDLGIKDRTLNAILQGISNRKHLPNLMFNITGKDLGELSRIINDAKSFGYEPTNVHLVWVLADYQVAISRNANRERVVPADIMLATHIGAAKTMDQIIQGKIPSGLDGGVYVILNNKENTIPFVRDGKPVTDRSGNLLVKDFTYLNLKAPGKSFSPHAHIQKQLYSWIQNNVPRAALSSLQTLRRRM